MEQHTQKSKEWLEQRRGKFTSSNLDCLLVTGKSESTLGAGAITLCYEKLAERLSTETRSFKSQYTDWGIDHEEEAIKFFEDNSSFEVDEAFFVSAPDDMSEISGGSPDGYVTKVNESDEGDVSFDVAGIIEVKCPHDPSIHLHTLIHKELPPKNHKKYYAQMQWNMYCCKVDKCYFISYDPRMKDYANKMVVLEIKRDEEHITLLKERILIANDFVEELRGKI